MEGRIRGSYPGGPRREGSEEAPARTPRLTRVEDIEAGLARRRLRRTRKQRRRRLVVGFVLSLFVAAGIGWGLGRRSHRTSEELVERERQENSLERALSQQVNRTLLELWRMEDVEYMRNRGRP